MARHIAERRCRCAEAGGGSRSPCGSQRESVAKRRAAREPRDNTGEERLKQRLQAVIETKTVILVTHRASLLSLVDRLLVIDRGQILADGPKIAVMEALKKGQISVA